MTLFTFPESNGKGNVVLAAPEDWQVALNCVWLGRGARFPPGFQNSPARKDPVIELFSDLSTKQMDEVKKAIETVLKSLKLNWDQPDLKPADLIEYKNPLCPNYVILVALRWEHLVKFREEVCKKLSFPSPPKGRFADPVTKEFRTVIACGYAEPIPIASVNAIKATKTDFRWYAAIVLMITAPLTMFLAWWYQTIPFFPIFVSWCGFHVPGYYVLSLGLTISGTLLSCHHQQNDSGMMRQAGMFGSFMMAMMGLINGDKPDVVNAHGVYSNLCFLSYFIYIYLSGHRSKWLYVGFAAFVLNMAVPILSTGFVGFPWLGGVWEWITFHKTAGVELALEYKKARALLQWTMIVCFFRPLFAIHPSPPTAVDKNKSQ